MSTYVQPNLKPPESKISTRPQFYFPIPHVSAYLKLPEFVEYSCVARRPTGSRQVKWVSELLGSEICPIGVSQRRTKVRRTFGCNFHNSYLHFLISFFPFSVFCVFVRQSMKEQRQVIRTAGPSKLSFASMGDGNSFLKRYQFKLTQFFS